MDAVAMDARTHNTRSLKALTGFKLAVGPLASQSIKSSSIQTFAMDILLAPFSMSLTFQHLRQHLHQHGWKHHANLSRTLISTGLTSDVLVQTASKVVQTPALQHRNARTLHT
jgi:hypothetical protein